MTGWLQLTDAQRKATIDQAALNSGIGAPAIEKDWWVTITLKALFQSSYARFIVFKGGTSLSKCWKLISRFSEDIDIALSPDAFGMEYKENPGNDFVKKMKRKCCAFTSTTLKDELEKQLTLLNVQPEMVTIDIARVPTDHPDTDPQTLFVQYNSLYEPDPYLLKQVKIEVSMKSKQDPHVKVPVQSLLNEFNPNPIYNEKPFEVEATGAVKTFLEKCYLLHEEFKKPDPAKIRIKRMSRHLYDISTMMDRVSNEALADHRLYEELIQQRKWYVRMSKFDYGSLGNSKLSFIPPPELLDGYREDYVTMQEQMIYGDTTSFEEIIQKLKRLQGMFRVKLCPTPFDEIEKMARMKLEKPGEFEEKEGTYKVIYQEQATQENTDSQMVYEVIFVNDGGTPIFECIQILAFKSPGNDVNLPISRVD